MFKRELTADLGDERLTLVATFRASIEIAEKVGDPLLIAREAALEAMFSSVGRVYEPKFRFTMKNVPVILHIGLCAGSDKRSLSEVEDLVFSAGILKAQDIATRYIAMIVEPKSEEINRDLEEKDQQKKEVQSGE